MENQDLLNYKLHINNEQNELKREQHNYKMQKNKQFEELLEKFNSIELTFKKEREASFHQE